MADANKTLITRAEVTSIITPATGRRALVLDGQTIELGDTGVRDLSGMFDAGTVASGTVTAHRIGNVVIWQFVNVTLTPDAINPWQIMSNPGGILTPFTSTYGSAVTNGMSGPVNTARILVAPSGAVSFQYAEPSAPYTASIVLVTNKPWPTTLPGVEQGQPVGV